MFIANDHNNYAQYVPVSLITLINLSDTHQRCKELLEQNGLSVSQPLEKSVWHKYQANNKEVL